MKVVDQETGEDLSEKLEADKAARDSDREKRKHEEPVGE